MSDGSMTWALCEGGDALWVVRAGARAWLRCVAAAMSGGLA